MRIAVLILPEGEKALPKAEDFRRAGFAVSDAVGRRSQPDALPGPERGGGRRTETPDGPMGVRPGTTGQLSGPDKGRRPDTPCTDQEREAARPRKSYCTSSKPSNASSTLIPS
ncbi:hypothetical protein Daes_0208 [Pseudodesulfovibrio aespoeensis Aspo-2]|uniref:Uncharacterized protein n=1 Tax=Pseudodesulfovibrio aespoeensis (strain ATCC 700646 / DSM 10631 / Aspo-2) TaxID=643562 RepID=E6VV84_PSEA9|nr:hypothetical protein Daes_0208 [Pseudodesulfovibrio aespoeensis Aspo-2]